MTFLKLGKYTINTDAITHINWEGVVRVHMQDGRTLSFLAESVEGQALAQYFNHSDNVVDLLLQDDAADLSESYDHGGKVTILWRGEPI